MTNLSASKNHRCWVCGEPSAFTDDCIPGFHLCVEHGKTWKAARDRMMAKEVGGFQEYFTVWDDFYWKRLPIVDNGAKLA